MIQTWSIARGYLYCLRENMHIKIYRVVRANSFAFDKDTGIL